MSGVRVREAGPADAETIAAFSNALSREEGYGATALQARHVRDEGFGSGARFGALIAEQGGRPVGYGCSTQPTLPSTPRAACICRTSTSRRRSAARAPGGR